MCADCGHISYDDPKVVVDSVIVAGDSVAMCGVFSIARIAQVEVIFRARFAAVDTPRFAAGPESLEVALFPWQRIPRDEIAFPSLIWALQAWQQAGAGPLGLPAGNPSTDPRGTRFLDAGRGGGAP